MESNMRTKAIDEKGSQRDLQEAVVSANKELKEVYLNIDKATK